MAKKSKRKTSAKKKTPTAKYTIGILHSGSAQETDHQKHLGEFKNALSAAGYAPPSIKFDDDHYANDDSGTLATEARKLVKSSDVLVASGGTRAMNALINARSSYGKLTTPIVFTSASNPPPADLYLTGINALTSEYDPQRLELVFELIGRPKLAKIRALKNPNRPNYNGEAAALNTKIAELNTKWNATIDFKIVDLPFSSTIDNAIQNAFSDFYNNKVQAVVVTADPLYYNHRDSAIKGAKATKIPTIYQWWQFAQDGGLISYGTKLQQAYQMAGTYVGLILQDMDAHGGQPTTILDILSPLSELVINTKTASQQNISIPLLLLAKADDIIT